jgi:UDP-2,3-diacylglucosamine pyrophosphatase LpxH
MQSRASPSHLRQWIDMPPVVVTSDLHLGSSYLDVGRFRAFLDHLPDGSQLVLNGDTIDIPDQVLNDEHQATLQALIDATARLRVIWILGNHDSEYHGDLGAIEVARNHAVAKDLYITHGDGFDQVTPGHQLFIAAFRKMHHMRMRLGATREHVAEYAKRYRLLFNHLRNSVRRKATDYARKEGFGAVVCGHVHFAEDTEINGVRYLNTGAWTGPHTHAVLCCDGRIKLCRDVHAPPGGDLLAMLDA